MKRLLTLVFVLALFGAYQASAYVSGLKVWGIRGQLTSTDLNGNFSKLNVGLDDVLTDAKVAASDSADAKFPGTFMIPLQGAVFDSSAANDSLTAYITGLSPVGNKPTLYVKNTAGVTETITLRLDFQVFPETAKLDSIRIPLWTESTNDDDYVTATVYDDSTETHYKTGATATTATAHSATARTTRTAAVTGINLVGGMVRLKLVVVSKADSLFIGEPTAYITKP